MSSSSGMSSVRFVVSSQSARLQGVLGWISFHTGDGLVVDGLALRRSRSGEYQFAWPGKKDGNGRVRHHVRPADDVVRQALEGELLAALFVELREGAA